MSWFAQALLNHKWLRYALVAIAVVAAVVVTVLTWGTVGSLTAAAFAQLSTAFASWAAASALLVTATQLGACLLMQWLASTFLARSLATNAALRAVALACAAASLSVMLLETTVVVSDVAAVDGVEDRTSLARALRALAKASGVPLELTVSYDDGQSLLTDDDTGGSSFSDESNEKAKDGGDIIATLDEADAAGFLPDEFAGDRGASRERNTSRVDGLAAAAGVTAGALLAAAVTQQDEQRQRGF